MLISQIAYSDFRKIELRTGKVLSAERVQGSEKLLKLNVDIGEKNEEHSSVTRQILAGIGTVYNPEDMIGRAVVVVTNLAPRAIMGLESNGMLLAANAERGPVLLCPDSAVVPGSEIR